MKNLKTSIVLGVTLMSLVGCISQPTTERYSMVDALESSAWDASQWISVVDAPVVEGTVYEPGNWRSADGANWFVSVVKNESNVTSAKWMTTALGVYELYVNGEVVGDEILKPGFTHYAKTKRSFTYDITPMLDKKLGAENTFSVQITPGWWGDKIITPAGHDGMIGKKCAFRGVLQVTYADGSVKLYGSDTENWKAGIAGPVKHAGIFDGEEYDAREPQGYLVADQMKAPEVNTEFNGDILPSNGAEIYLRKDLVMDPVKAYVWQDVENAKEDEFGKVVVSREYTAGDEITLQPGETLVVDFGQNAAAVPYFTFKAAQGTVLTCLSGEILNDGNGAKSRGMDGPEGSVHRDNLRIATAGGMKLTYTFAQNNSYVSYYPHATFFGYRYASITTTDHVTIHSIQSIPVTSITENLETGVITTGNEPVNKLISNTIWGQRSNYLSVPTDCPQRNERLGWTADTQVFAETGTFFANTDAFFHKWMRDMRDSQSETGAFPGVAPLGQYGENMMRLGWADAGIIVPWTVWKQFGDTQIVEENWDAMNRFMNHVNDTRYDHVALSEENGNYQWADWLSYESLESHGSDTFTNTAKGRIPSADAITYWSYLGASYWLIDAEMMRDMAEATNRDATVYQRMVNDAKTYIKTQFMKPDGSFKTDILNTMQTPALFALKNHLLDGVAKEAIIARLRKNFEEHDNCLQTGFLGTSILMQTLTDNGMSDVAYELLLQHKNPSWLYSIDNGATTIWERWNSYMLDKGMGPQGMNSFNHYAYGAVCAWLWESAAGIAADTKEPGFKHIIMKPVPDKRLGHLEASYTSAAGVIRSAWKYEGDQWIWEFTVPEGSTATVTLPGETASKDYEAGTYTVTK